jgi:hypothetical protein
LRGFERAKRGRFASVPLRSTPGFRRDFSA